MFGNYLVAALIALFVAILIIKNRRTTNRITKIPAGSNAPAPAPKNAPNAAANSARTRTHRGQVKWFNPTKGYGFIQPDDGSKDLFVHISAVERAGLATLNEGDIVDYELVDNRGKHSAENLHLVGR